MRLMLVAVVSGILVGLGAPAGAGQLPRCTVTVAQRVADADAVVVAEALGRTRRNGDDLHTRFAVRQVLRGKAPRQITVDDCWSWKCAHRQFRRGEVWLLLLDGAGARYELLGPRCLRGKNVSAVRYDPDDPLVKEIVAAATAPP
jgi:hypothetical protein